MAGTEECDNGNRKGCIGCKVDPLYTCKLLSGSTKASLCLKKWSHHQKIIVILFSLKHFYNIPEKLQNLNNFMKLS